MNAESAVERQVAVADFFELKSTQRLCSQPFLHSDDSIVVLNVKGDASLRVGQKRCWLAVIDAYIASDSIDNALLR